jgi:hypothetical protein
VEQAVMAQASAVSAARVVRGVFIAGASGLVSVRTASAPFQ